MATTQTRTPRTHTLALERLTVESFPIASTKIEEPAPGALVTNTCPTAVDSRCPCCSLVWNC